MKISKSLYKKVVKYTSTDYEPFIKADEDFVMIDSERAVEMIEDLLFELNYREEELEDLKNDINENYIPVRYNEYDYLGVSEDDF